MIDVTEAMIEAGEAELCKWLECDGIDDLVPLSVYKVMEAARIPAAPDVVERAILNICRDVCELPDRSSPDDEPDTLLVTLDELSDICRSVLTAAPSAIPIPAPTGEVERPVHIERVIEQALEGILPSNLQITAVMRAVHADGRQWLEAHDDARSSPDEGDALKARPADSGRVCTVCKAGVAAWPNVMVCHCYEMPWQARTDPPVAMDEVDDVIRRLTLMAEQGDHGRRPDKGHVLRRSVALLTRIKDSSK